MNNENLHKELSRFAKNVIKQSRRNLTTSGRRDTNKLYDSLGYELEVYKNSFSLGFFMEEHGEYVDKGVKGAKDSSRAPNSPFQFGSGTGRKGGLTEQIDKWVKRKGLQFRKQNGQFMTHKATVGAITRSIYNKGIKPSMFFTKPFESSFSRLPDDIIERFALDVESLLSSSIQNTNTQ